MAKKIVVRYCSNYHGETTVPAFLITTKYEDLKSKRIRFAKDWQTCLTLLVVYISHLESNFFKK